MCSSQTPVFPERGQKELQQKNEPVVKSSLVCEVRPYPFIRNRIDPGKTNPLELHYPAWIRPDELIQKAEIIVHQVRIGSERRDTKENGLDSLFE